MDPESVAQRLLGKLLVRIYQGARLSGYIVETEAYFGTEDPASRARKGGNLAKIMAGDVGIALIYGVHRQWLFNVVAHEPERIGAVLIRAIEPVEGIGIMKKLRGTSDLKKLTNGPGRLTKALAIDKSFHGKPVCKQSSLLRIEEGVKIHKVLIGRSYRIGVSKDLSKPFRFYIKNNPYVSR